MVKSKEKMSLLRFLGSIYFAAMLLGLLAILLAVSTWVESTFSTPFAQKLVYQAGWFDAFLLLLAVNIFFSTVSRWPFKKKHAGFVMTHIGILLLLGGSLASRLQGVDGQMYLPEGLEDHSIRLNEYELSVQGPHGEQKSSIPLGKKGSGHYDLPVESGQVRLHIDQIADEVELGEFIHEGGPEDAENPALKVVLDSQAMGAHIESWLMASHPFRGDTRLTTAGPATLQLLDQRPPDEDTPPVLVIQKSGKNLVEWRSTDPIKPGSFVMDSKKVQITSFEYYPDARVGAEGKLVNASEDPANPAVRLEIRDEAGHERRYLRFANFPDFESIHGNKGEDAFGLTVEFSGGSQKIKGPALVFFQENGQWHYESRNRAGELKAEGTVVPGQSVATGWVDFQFKVETIHRRALAERTVKERAGAPEGPAAKISVEQDGKIIAQDWLISGEPYKAPIHDDLYLVLRQKHVEVPFALQLIDFRKVDYPGTDRPASFESDVQLTDPKEKVTIKKTIRMNQPLDYAGYRIFQSSYVQNQGQESSIFTVAKNPGIFWIYFGSIVIFTGAFITFFIPSLSSFRH